MKLEFLKKPGWTPGFLFFLIFVGVGFFVATRKTSQPTVYENICYFVSDHIYVKSDELNQWTKACVAHGRQVSAAMTSEQIIQDLNQRFGSLHTSHLSIYSEKEAKKVWEGDSLETGIESRYVDGELVISKIHRHSPADELGLRAGDVIDSINKELGNPELAEKQAGAYVIRRKGKRFEYQVQPAAIHRDEEIQVVPVSAKTVVLKVPSFRAEFFEGEKWREQIAELKKHRKIILDLRGNIGGNFVAGLRLLSAFMCSPQQIGYLWKPKSNLKLESVLPDELDDSKQLDILDESFLVNLRTFEGYGCLASSVVVLVDGGTASTSEMVAQALKDYIGAKVFGSASAGQLLVGVWYPLPELGQGTRISVPEAVYQTRRGHRLEGPGVQVDRVLYYHLSELENGEDSWIKKAIELF